MAQLKKAPRRRDQETAQGTTQPFPAGLKLLAIGLVAAIGGGILATRNWNNATDPKVASRSAREGEATVTKSSTQGPSTSSKDKTAADSTQAADYSGLVGRWTRTDGGYIINIESVDAAGNVTAKYLNPRSIKVEKAEASMADGSLLFVMVLRDVNYPGSTYQLRLAENKQSLVGQYFQAVTQENFSVEFIKQ